MSTIESFLQTTNGMRSSNNC